MPRIDNIQLEVACELLQTGLGSPVDAGKPMMAKPTDPLVPYPDLIGGLPLGKPL
jgi:hypothetical protein